MAGDSNKKGFSGLSDLVSEISDSNEPINSKLKAEASPLSPKQSSQPQRKSAAPAPKKEIPDAPQSSRNDIKSNDTAQPVQSTAKHLPQPQRESAVPTSEPQTTNSSHVSSGKDNAGSNGKLIGWFCILAVVSLAIYISGNQEKSNKKYPTSSPSVSKSYSEPQSSSTPTTQKSGTAIYKEPIVGTNNVLSVSEIRWCLREDIRIGAMRNVVDTNAGIGEFNRIVNDYNSRCGNYRYRQGAQSQAEREVKPYRSQIASEAIHEAKRMNQLDSQKPSPESTSFTQRRSLEEQQPSTVPNKPFDAQESSPSFFNESDLDCQKSPVMCKDQANRPVSGVVLTFGDNNLRKASTFLNGNPHGPTISFYQSKGINWITNFKNGRMDGPSIQLYENGSGLMGEVKWVIPFSNGLAEGIRRGYYETGELKSETNYTNGKENGYLYEFYKNGYLKSSEQYVGGKKIGEKITFGSNVERKEHAQLRPSEQSAVEDLDSQALNLLNQLKSLSGESSAPQGSANVTIQRYSKSANFMLGFYYYCSLDNTECSKSDARTNLCFNENNAGIQTDGMFTTPFVWAQEAEDKIVIYYKDTTYKGGRSSWNKNGTSAEVFICISSDLI